jgi:hypothetical protein
LAKVIVGVGGQAQTFLIHKDLFCHKSPYFRAAFDGAFKKGVEQKLELDDVEPQTFAPLAAWVYTGTIEEDKPENPKNLKSRDEDGYTCGETQSYEDISFLCETMRLPKLWVLAGHLMMPVLQNSCADLIYEANFIMFDVSFCLDWYKYVHDQHAEPLIKLAAHMFVLQKDEYEFDEVVDEIPSSVIVQMARIVASHDIDGCNMKQPKSSEFHVSIFRKSPFGA